MLQRASRLHIERRLKQQNESIALFQMPGDFINDVSACVDESLIGYVRTYNHLELAGRAVISRSPTPSVAVISGNGSGHEPAMVRRESSNEHGTHSSF